MFRTFTEDGETVAVSSLLTAIPFCDMALEDPPMMRFLALLDAAGVATLSLSDMLTLFAISDPPSQEDRLAVFVGDAAVSQRLTFPDFLRKTDN